MLKPSRIPFIPGQEPQDSKAMTISLEEVFMGTIQSQVPVANVTPQAWGWQCYTIKKSKPRKRFYIFGTERLSSEPKETTQAKETTP